MRRNGNDRNMEYSEAKHLTDKSLSETSILFKEYHVVVNCPHNATLIRMSIPIKINNLTTDHPIHTAELTTYQCPTPYIVLSQSVVPAL